MLFGQLLLDRPLGEEVVQYEIYLWVKLKPPSAQELFCVLELVEPMFIPALCLLFCGERMFFDSFVGGSIQ